tara:strand:+ start:3193 stop:5271 length:2079 start_codon:yes stop_codon:yes gene_type:complete
MSNRMLVDASHDEETRVIVLDKEGKIQEFDLEAKDKNQIRGNIYLAKVTRVEPSLQAAFVEYGGNRHGFLPFSEIHPDYYQIPTSEKRKIIEQDALDQPDMAEEDEKNELDDDIEVTNKKVSASRKRYKIQEVIKKRQIILVQVTKEERGNKGAAITTYISLAGRYCVLMPNTAKGGGISRKIADIQTRNKLKTTVSSLMIPDGMGVIIRTAGAQRTKTEIKRDFQYLIRLWETIRDLTLNSSAPALIYEEGSLIKRSIRDLYNKDIDEIIVSGEKAFNEAKIFMKMLIPSHVKFIKKYANTIPLFTNYQAERELGNMYTSNVSLPSGGYLVINQTEALVAIDVNSGRSTREHNIEDTAHRTNLEASDEVARQLRLRDLAGLIVIDYIDMEERRNNRSVEKRLKDALKNDRARIQVGHISQFGLMEMSRQRMRSSVIESSMTQCHHCQGSGKINSISTLSIQILRAIEEDIIRNGRNNILLCTNKDLSNYLLNSKRSNIYEIERKYNINIIINIDDSLTDSIYSIKKEEVASDEIESSELAAISIDTVYENETNSLEINDKKDEAREIEQKIENKAKKIQTKSKSKKIVDKKVVNKKDIETPKNKPIKKTARNSIKKEKQKTKEIKQKEPIQNKPKDQNNNEKKGSSLKNKKQVKKTSDSRPKKLPSKSQPVKKNTDSIRKNENLKTGWWDN